MHPQAHKRPEAAHSSTQNRYAVSPISRFANTSQPGRSQHPADPHRDRNHHPNPRSAALGRRSRHAPPGRPLARQPPPEPVHDPQQAPRHQNPPPPPALRRARQPPPHARTQRTTQNTDTCSGHDPARSQAVPTARSAHAANRVTARRVTLSDRGARRRAPTAVRAVRLQTDRSHRSLGRHPAAGPAAPNHGQRGRHPSATCSLC
jgi:hypothetical protein